MAKMTVFEPVDIAAIAEEVVRFKTAEYWRQFFAEQKLQRERRENRLRWQQQVDERVDAVLDSMYGAGYAEYCRLNREEEEEEIVDWAKDGF